MLATQPFVQRERGREKRTEKARSMSLNILVFRFVNKAWSSLALVCVSAAFLSESGSGPPQVPSHSAHWKLGLTRHGFKD